MEDFIQQVTSFLAERAILRSLANVYQQRQYLQTIGQVSFSFAIIIAVVTSLSFDSNQSGFIPVNDHTFIEVDLVDSFNLGYLRCQAGQTVLTCPGTCLSRQQVSLDLLPSISQVVKMVTIPYQNSE